jgi:ABC-2 type transport system permease protein
VRWFHIGIKDLKITVRDVAAVGVLLGMPIVLIFILGSALGNLNSSIGKIPVAIVDLDKGRVGAKVTDGFFTDSQLVKLFDARRMRSVPEAQAAVASGDLAGALVVPAEFSRRLDTGRPGQLTIYTDPGRDISATVFRSVATALSTRVSAASIAARTSAFYVIPLASRDPGIVGSTIAQAVSSATATGALELVTVKETTSARGKEVRNLDYYAGSMSAMFILFGAMFGAFSLVRERSDWTLPRIMTTPATRADIVGGKVFGVMAVGMAQWAVLYAFTAGVFGVHWGSAASVWLVATGTVWSAAGMSVFIAAVGRTVRSVSGIAQLMIQAMAALGGSFFPVAAFPAWLQPLHYLTVNGWAVDGFLASMRGAGLVAVLPDFGALVLLGALFFGVGVWRLRWE